MFGIAELGKIIKRFNFKAYFSQGHARSVKAKKNIAFSFLLKGFSIVISFLIIPLTIGYLTPFNYGIWLTLISIVGWFTFFDLGLGNGLRNKFAEALARNDKELAKTYVSTTYAIISIIFLSVFVLFAIIFPFLNWSRILNVPEEIQGEVAKLAFIVVGFFCLQFILKLISALLTGDQRPALNGSLNTIANFIALIVVFTLTKTTEGSLLYLGISVSFVNLLVPLVASILLFGRDYKEYRPSFKYIKWEYAPDLMKMGFNFFLMQVAAIVVFSTDNIIIAQLFSPEEVTSFNIAFKYFGLVTMGFNIITTPFWSAYTEAYHKEDFEWIKRVTRQLTAVWLVLVFVVIGMVFFSDYFYKMWVGDKVRIPFLVSVCMGIWVLMGTWITIFGNFLSGVGKVRLSIYHSIVVMIVNIPICILFAKYLHLGIAGITIGTCICVFPQVILHPLQYGKIINKKDSGIWGK